MAYFYAAKAGPDIEALKLGFQKCGQLAASGQHTDIALAVPAKGTVQGLIEDLIGEKAARLLLRDNALDLNGLTLHLVTERIPLRQRGPVLAAWTKLTHIDTLARSHYTTDLIYLPWLDEELVEFQQRFPSATVL